MIVESVLELFLGMLSSLFSGFELLKLPMDTLNTLLQIIGYGNWVVGVDIMALFGASVVFWWGLHLSIGLIVWVWERLPLT